MSKTYTITKETIEKVLDALDDHCFSEDGEYNNTDVMEAEEDLRQEIKSQINKRQGKQNNH